MKFAFLSHVLPPSWSGQAMMIRRLLAGLTAQDYCLISQQDYSETGADAYSSRLPAKYYQLPADYQLTRGHRYGLSKVRTSLNILLGILDRGRRIAEIVRREKCQAVVACTGGDDLLDLPAGYVASRLARVAFFPYMFDYYSYQWGVNAYWKEISGRSFATRLERLVLRGATRVIVPNEYLRDELQRRYQVEAAVIHNPCDLSDYETAPAPAREAGPPRVVYTGAVYDAHYDAFRNLVTALEALRHLDLKLHLYTAQPPALLAEQGIHGPVVFHQHQAVQTMPAVQRAADVLFLPLAFSSPYPEIIRTSAPGKVGEYLASRRPVLVHAPPDSFIAWYFRHHECGLVVDQNDPVKVAEALTQLLADPGLQSRLIARARERAEADFSVTSVQDKFLRVVNSGRARRARAETSPGSPETAAPTSGASEVKRVR